MKPSVMRHFGLPQNYERRIYEGAPYRMFRDDLRGILLRSGMVAVIGETGAGKTTLVEDVIRSLKEDFDVVRVRSLDKERLRIGNVVSAMVYDLSQEGPRRDAEARARQLSRIVGMRVVSDQRRVVVILENAHRIHGNTILALKELREMTFAGHSKLFGIVLIGQLPLLAKIQRLKEIYLRMDVIEMTREHGWMSYEERKRYLKTVYGEALNEELCARAAYGAGIPLELNALVESRMEAAFYAGRELGPQDFDIPLKTMKEVAGISFGEIADQVGYDRSTVSRVINGQYKNDKLAALVREAIAGATGGGGTRDRDETPDRASLRDNIQRKTA